jgi:selenide,water dikinase
MKTGASTRNWSGYGDRVDLGSRGQLEQTLLTDPQTSGGLLVTCAPETVDTVLDVFRREGFDRATVIGEIVAGEPKVTVT